jgi:hypothetical protein
MCLPTWVSHPRGLKEGEFNDNRVERTRKNCGKGIQGVATVRTCVRVVWLNQVNIALRRALCSFYSETPPRQNNLYSHPSCPSLPRLMQLLIKTAHKERGAVPLKGRGIMCTVFFFNGEFVNRGVGYECTNQSCVNMVY